MDVVGYCVLLFFILLCVTGGVIVANPAARK
jgi:hypothetical protein